ncbi:hypothetical protein QNO07_22240 [Streptomyces sp. 549]|uniref:hypothetical protein n=1 Tax=Streptomyces sp. 549 TaxID=3049076 RepID=UPI0024C2DBA8|nr:hypothetical protein [Streptomyces sp. 549]MDK1476106.1 hypothetical protein [Streptomyces sp. 549]
MKTTLLMRSTANPDRTTLAHLTDAAELTREEAEHPAELPPATANPRRTVLMDAPVAG